MNGAIESVEFKGRKFLVMGIQGSGKTEFVKEIVRKKYTRSIIWTEHIHDWEDVTKGDFPLIYQPQSSDHVAELEKFCESVKRVNTDTTGRFEPFDAIFFDDFDASVTNGMLPPVLRDLNANHRHYKNLSIFFIVRRPQQLNTNIVESCHYIVAYCIEGENVFSKLGSISKSFEIAVRQLKYKDYRYVLKKIGEEPVICKPIR